LLKREFFMNVGSLDVVGSLPSPVPPEPIDLDRITNLRTLEALLPGPGADTIRVGYLREAELHFARIAGPNPSPVEAMLARTVAANWLEGKLLRRRYATGASGRDALPVLDHLQKSLARCERRLMSALKTLVLLRGLNVKLETLRMSLLADSGDD
jgi:hypothetical protein